MRLHDWLYDIVCEVCYDREYLYVCFVQSFGGLMNDIFAKGKLAASGEYEICGLKSGKKAVMNWQLESRIDMMRLNAVTLDCSIINAETGSEESHRRQSFELSAGESAEVKSYQSGIC